MQVDGKLINHLGTTSFRLLQFQNGTNNAPAVKQNHLCINGQRGMHKLGFCLDAFARSLAPWRVSRRSSVTSGALA